MSLPNGASSATLAKKKTQLPNPFDLDDSQILDKVYLTHLHDDEKCDKDIIFNIVSTIVLNRSAESRAVVTSFQPEFRTLKQISCQMIKTPPGLHYVHQTTMWILQQLKTYSWDAKTLITLAAFALEYGNLLYLNEVSTPTQLVNSLKQLNQVQNRKLPADTNYIGLVGDVVQHIQDWATWSGYDTEEVPSLSDALQEIPNVVYWTLAFLVASTGNLTGVTDYTLSDFTERLSSADNKLKEHLKRIKEQIDFANDYWRRKKAFSNAKNVVEFLKLLIHRNNGSPTPQVYDGSTKNKSDIEVFRQKHVLLFISSLNSIDDEILLLNSMYDRLQESPEEIIKGYKKEDFKILWIPIVEDVWDVNLKIKFNNLKNKIKWYAVEYFYELPGIRLIRENLNYLGDPVIPVINSQGEIINGDAMHLIFQWGIDAFPFRKIDSDDLTLKWKWFWDVAKKVNLGIQVKGDRYIFIFGGADKKWIQNFTLAVDKIKRHETILSADAIIEYYQLGKDDPKIVPRFWIEIESKKLKKHQEGLDCKIQEIVKSLLCLKQDPQGWVILSKGSNIKVLGHADPMYETVKDFDIWKDKVFQKEGFDIAFKEYYETRVKEMYARQPCATINVDIYDSNVLATITCPNPTCGRVMEVTSINYKCCHSDASDNRNGKI